MSGWEGLRYEGIVCEKHSELCDDLVHAKYWTSGEINEGRNGAILISLIIREEGLYMSKEINHGIS